MKSQTTVVHNLVPALEKGNQRQLAILVTTTSFLVVVVGMLIGQGLFILNLALIATLVISLLGMVLLIQPGWFIPLLLIYIWFIVGRADPGGMLSQYPFVRWGTYALIPAFFAISMMRLLPKRRWHWTFLTPWIALLAALTVLSGLMNGSSILQIIYSLGIYLRYPLLFVLLVNLQFDAKYWRMIVGLFLSILVLLTLEAISNYMFLGRSSDSTFITLGGAFGHVTAGFIFIYGMSIVAAHALVTTLRWYHFIVIILVTGAAIIATIRSILLVVPVIILLLLLVEKEILNSRKLILVLLMGLATLVAAAFLPWDSAMLRSYQLGWLDPGYRFHAIREVWQILVRSGDVWFGFGPRSMSPGSLGGAGRMYTSLVELYGEYFARTVSLSQFINGLSEMGLVGFTVYLLMLFRILTMNLQLYVQSTQSRVKNSNILFWRVISLAFIGLWLEYAILGLAYYDLWRIDISSMIFWGLAAAIYAEDHRRYALLRHVSGRASF